MLASQLGMETTVDDVLDKGRGRLRTTPKYCQKLAERLGENFRITLADSVRGGLVLGLAVAESPSAVIADFFLMVLGSLHPPNHQGSGRNL